MKKIKKIISGVIAAALSMTFFTMTASSEQIHYDGSQTICAVANSGSAKPSDFITGMIGNNSELNERLDAGETVPVYYFKDGSCLMATVTENSNKIINVDDIRLHYEQILNSPEWITTEDRIERGKMLQFSDDEIASMDTDTLIEAVLEYPFFSDIYLFDDINVGIDALFSSFNGIRELSTRDDAAQKLLQKYSEEKILATSEVGTSNADKRIERLSNLEVLLAQDFVVQNLNENELVKLNEI